MDCKKAVRDYLLDLIEQTGEGQIKTLILDEETTKITSLSFAQSDLLKKEIYLFVYLEQCNEDMAFLASRSALDPLHLKLNPNSYW